MESNNAENLAVPEEEKNLDNSHSDVDDPNSAARKLEGLDLDDNAEMETVPGKKLNLDLLKNMMIGVNNGFDAGKTDIKVFAEMYIEWTKLFQHFGKAIYVAFKGKYTLF